MREYVFFSLMALHLQAADIGNISELKGEALVNRSGEALTAELQLGVESYDDVRTGNSRVGLTLLTTALFVLLSIRSLYLTRLYLTQILVNLKSDSPLHQALHVLLQEK